MPNACSPANSTASQPLGRHSQQLKKAIATHTFTQLSTRVQLHPQTETVCGKKTVRRKTSNAKKLRAAEPFPNFFLTFPPRHVPVPTHVRVSVDTGTAGAAGAGPRQAGHRTAAPPACALFSPGPRRRQPLAPAALCRRPAVDWGPSGAGKKRRGPHGGALTAGPPLHHRPPRSEGGACPARGGNIRLQPNPAPHLGLGSALSQ